VGTNRTREEAAPLNELRAILGNKSAIDAYRSSTLPFPDGTVLVKLPGSIFIARIRAGSYPRCGHDVQVMVKDSRKYTETGGWGFGRFVSGKPADEAQRINCATPAHRREVLIMSFFAYRSPGFSGGFLC